MNRHYVFLFYWLASYYFSVHCVLGDYDSS